ncbi:MAG TPA: DNA mismatch repair protein [Micavibrio sp.]|nr:DNA mismatch repair protein [Micavibrio sp.]
MGENKLISSTEITHDGVKSLFKNSEPLDAIFELVWNGLDANANNIDVIFAEHQLGALETILILDDGHGIDIRNEKDNFGKFNDSSKKFDCEKHGSLGRGRLTFHKLCDTAIWHTRTKNYDANVKIKSSAIKNFEISYLEDAASNHPYLEGIETGTCVELYGFNSKFFYNDPSLPKKFSNEFGWLLALNPNKSIRINGQEVLVPPAELHKRTFLIDGHRFEATLIRWYEKPSSEKSYNYFLSHDYRTIDRELSSFNCKVAFYSSLYIFSEWIDKYDPNILEIDPASVETNETKKKLKKQLLDFQNTVYKDFLRSHVDKELKRYEKNGFFPSYKDVDPNYAEWRKSNTKKVVRELYFADPSLFNKLNDRQAKVLVRLLDIVLISNENDALFDVLDGVLDLSAESLVQLSEHLKQSTLENIISTIEVLKKRQIAVHKLKELIGLRYKEILETPDLQKIIEQNTWLFGPQYATIGAEEDTFTKICRNLRDRVPHISDIVEADLEDDVEVIGAQKQVDLFLARKIPTFDALGNEIYKCVIVEIKRPSISLNKKHLRQLEDYAEIIAKTPEFKSNKLVFELILIGRTVSRDDVTISQRMQSLKSRGEYGLVTLDEENKIKCYVKDWFTIFDEFSLTNNYLLEQLNTKLDDLADANTKDMVSDLQKAEKSYA